MRLGVVSDIHGQPRALEAALAAMERIDGLICLGDSINQTRFCNETVSLLRCNDALTIVGNHEEGFFAGPGRNADTVDGALAEWLQSRPQRIDTRLCGRRIVLVHATTWPSAYAYVAPTHRDFARFAEEDADVVLYGHTHQPVVSRVGAALVVNPGSVGEGRPTNNGFVRSCALLDLDTLSARIIDLD